MSYEMLRFGWQKLLVNQVPQKGGRRGAPVIQGPPPRDWSPEWNRVTTAGQSALKNIDEIDNEGDNSEYISSYNYYIYYNSLKPKDPRLPKPLYKPMPDIETMKE